MILHLKQQPVELIQEDIELVREYKYRWYYFIPFVGVIVMMQWYIKTSRKTSLTMKRLMNNYTTSRFTLSVFSEIIFAMVVQYLFIIMVLTSIILGCVIGWAWTLDNGGAISLLTFSIITGVLFVFVIIFVFLPFFIKSKLEKSIVAAELLLNKKYNSNAGLML